MKNVRSYWSLALGRLATPASATTRNWFLNLTIVIGVTMAGPAFANCQLDATDFASLSVSKSEIHSQAQVDALDDAHQNLICVTRASWRQFHANGNRFFETPGHYSLYYMSPDEGKTYYEAVDAWIEAHMAH